MPKRESTQSRRVRGPAAAGLLAAILAAWLSCAAAQAPAPSPAGQGKAQPAQGTARPSAPGPQAGEPTKEPQNKAADVEIYDESTCGSLSNHHGPFDYRLASAEERRLVEGAHFNRDVESLKGYYNVERGMRGSVGADIDYTLRAFPNHPRALMAMMRLSDRDKVLKPQGARYPLPCYFERAVRFAPDDAGVRVVYGIYLLRKETVERALKQLDTARGMIGEDANLQYNLGLGYFEAQQYDRALEHARKAYALGFPLPGLRDKLKSVNRWQE